MTLQEETHTQQPSNRVEIVPSGPVVPRLDGSLEELVTSSGYPSTRSLLSTTRSWTSGLSGTASTQSLSSMASGEQPSFASGAIFGTGQANQLSLIHSSFPADQAFSPRALSGALRACTIDEEPEIFYQQTLSVSGISYLIKERLTAIGVYDALIEVPVDSPDWSSTHIPSWTELATSSAFTMIQQLNKLLVTMTPSTSHGSRHHFSQGVVQAMFDGCYTKFLQPDEIITKDSDVIARLDRAAKNFADAAFSKFSARMGPHDTNVKYFEVTLQCWAMWYAAMIDIDAFIATKRFSVGQVRRLLKGPNRTTQVRIGIVGTPLGRHLTQLRTQLRGELGQSNSQRLLSIIFFWVYYLTPTLYSSSEFQNMPLDSKQVTQTNTSHKQSAKLPQLEFGRFSDETKSDMIFMGIIKILKCAGQVTKQLRQKPESNIRSRRIYTSRVEFARTIAESWMETFEPRTMRTQPDWYSNQNSSWKHMAKAVVQSCTMERLHQLQTRFIEAARLSGIVDLDYTVVKIAFEAHGFAPEVGSTVWAMLEELHKP